MIQPRFGVLTVGLILADMFNAMGSLAGVDLAISAYGEHKAQRWEMMFRSLPPEERYALVEEFREKTGFMKHWTGETVPLLIGHLPEKTREQRELKLKLGKRAIHWYLHLNTPFNHYLALKVADQMAHIPEFRQFMHTFVPEKVLPLPEEHETSTLMRFFFHRRRNFDGKPLAHYVMGFPYVVDKLAGKFDRITTGIMEKIREERALIQEVFQKPSGDDHASAQDTADIPDHLPMALDEDLKYLNPHQALSQSQVALLEEHMDHLGPPLNPIGPMYKKLYQQWLLDHPLILPKQSGSGTSKKRIRQRRATASH